MTDEFKILIWRICHFYLLQSERLQKVLDYVNEVHSLCAVLGLDFAKTVNDVHPSLNVPSIKQSRNISDSTLEGLNQVITRLKTEKKFRYQKVFCLSNNPVLAPLWFFILNYNCCSWKMFLGHFLTSGI